MIGKNVMDRNELHYRVMLLRDEIRAGRVRLREGLDVAASLARVRIASDGKVDPDTVDGVVRALALTVHFKQLREDLKRIPLRESQAEYFEILDQFFGKPYAQMKKHGVTPHQVAAQMASQPRIVEAFKADSAEFIKGIEEFWKYHAPIVEAHLQDLHALKTVFGGDIFPSYTQNIVTPTGLYIDTTILPDPLLRTLGLATGGMKPDRLFYLTTKHALNALQYRDMALAEVNPPIVVIAPDHSYLEEPYRPVLQLAGESDLLLHAGKLFSRSFTDVSEFEKYAATLASAKDLVAAISDPHRLLFDVEWSEPLEEQVRRFRAELAEQFGRSFEHDNAGQIARMALTGRMMQANDILFKASRYGGNPLVDAPTSWQYLLWKYEYDGIRGFKPGEGVRDVLISKAISVEGSAQLGLLAGLTVEALIDLRKAGAMSELRELIRKGIGEVDTVSPSSFAEVGEAVVTNLCEAFAKHRRALAELSSGKKKFYGFDVSRWLAIGGISVGAAATGSVPLGVLAAAGTMVGTPGIAELKAKWQELRTKTEQLRRSPTGILFRNLDRG
jgi:hypothetical protein